MPDDILDVSGPEYAKAMAHPMRHRVLLELGEHGATISQLANRIATNKGNVAHHLGVLVAAGLAKRDRTRTVRGGTEQYYVRAAQRIRFDTGPDGLVAMMENLTREMAADDDALLNHRVLRLTRRQAEALKAHLDRFVADLVPAGDREARYGVVVGAYRYGRPTGRR